MSFDLNLPGLDHLLTRVHPGRTLVVEGSVEPAKAFLVQHLAAASAGNGQPVTMLVTRPVGAKADAGRAAVAQHPVANWQDVAQAKPTGNLVVDSYSLLGAEASVGDMASHLRRRRDEMTASGSIQILAVEPAMLDSRQVAVLHHFADGIIQFHAREDSEGVTHFLRVPKWPGGETLTGNMYYGFDGKRLSIDTRKRVT